MPVKYFSFRALGLSTPGIRFICQSPIFGGTTKWSKINEVQIQFGLFSASISGVLRSSLVLLKARAHRTFEAQGNIIHSL